MVFIHFICKRQEGMVLTKSLEQESGWERVRKRKMQHSKQQKRVTVRERKWEGERGRAGRNDKGRQFQRNLSAAKKN